MSCSACVFLCTHIKHDALIIVQVETLYGVDAEKVISHKRALGMVKKDQNVPDGELFLIEQCRIDVANETKKRRLALYMLHA